MENKLANANPCRIALILYSGLIMSKKLTVSVAEACHMTGLSSSTIYRMFERKELTRHKIGAKVLIRVDELTALITESAEAA